MTMLREVEWAVQDGPITKNGVFPVTTLVSRKFCFKFKNFVYRVVLMYQPTKCPYSYFLKALVFYLRLLFPCENP